MSVASMWVRLAAAALGASMVTTAGCGGGGGSGGGSLPPPGGVPSVFVVTTDFDTGSFSVFPLGQPEAIARSLGDIHSDAVARTHGGLVYVVNRLGGDSIQAIDPAAGWATLWQCSVGNGTNPHDIVFVAPDKAYVTLYERATLAIVDPSVGPTCTGFLRGSVDLGPLADADGVPEMDQAALVGSRLYVTLQRLDRRNFFQPTEASVLAVIDTATDALVDVDPTTPAVDGIRLAGTNPFAESHGLTVDAATGAILVGSVGSFGVIGDGGIERIDTRTNRSEGFLVTERDLGANITDFVLVSDRQAYALLLDRASTNSLVRFDPTTRAVTGTLLTSSEFLVDIELDPTRHELYVTDRTLAHPGLRIFSPSDDRELTAAPIDTGLAPFDIVFVGGEEPAPPGAVAVAPGFYVGTTTEGQPIALEVASIDTVYLVCGGRTVRANAGGQVAPAGTFAVTVGGISIDGQFDGQGGVTGTLAGAGCSADFTATRRPGARDTDGDGVPDLVDPDSAPPACGNGTRESGEQCDDGNASNADDCLTTCVAASRGDGVVWIGHEECDGADTPCGAGAHCGADCRCHAAVPSCSATTVTIDLETPVPIAAAAVVLDYPEDAVAIPGSGDAPAVTARIRVLTDARLFGNGAPNDQDDRLRFTLVALDGVGAGPLLEVRFDCLGARPAARAFQCTVTDAVALDGVTPVPEAACTLHIRSE